MGWFDDNHPMGACAQGECTCCLNSRNYENPYPWMVESAQGGGQAARSFAWEDRYKKGDRKCSKCAVMKTSKDFSKEEVDKAANKRVCNKCGPPLPPLPCRMEELSSLTVAALKLELQRRSLSVSGVKAVLVQRLTAEV
ncbi:hypothetical protein T484DRAFT_1874217, partial [Baffinella frigidus]